MTDQSPEPITDEAITSLPQEYHSIVEVFAPSTSDVKLITIDGGESTVPVVHLPVRCFTQSPGEEAARGQQVTVITVPLDLVQEVVAGLAHGFGLAAEANGIDIASTLAPPSAEGQRAQDPRLNGGYL